MGNAHFLVQQMGNKWLRLYPIKPRIPLKVNEKIRTLTRLIALIQVLQERFKSWVSTNHLKAALYTQRELLKGETITLGGFVTICATC